MNTQEELKVRMRAIAIMVKEAQTFAHDNGLQFGFSRREVEDIEEKAKTGISWQSSSYNC